MCLPLNFALNRICIAQLTFTCSNQQWKHHDNGWNLFKVNNKDTSTTSTTSLWCLYYWLWKISHIVRLMFSLLTLNKCLLYSRLFFKDICRTFVTKYSRMDQEKFFKGYRPQISLGLLLNTLSILWGWLLLIERCLSVSRGFNKVSWNCIKYAKKRVFSDPYSPL